MALDLNELTLGQQNFICQQMGLRGLKHLAMAADEMPPQLLMLVGYLIKHDADENYTLADAESLTATEVLRMITDPNDEGEGAITPTETTSPPSVLPTATRRKSSTRSIQPNS